MPNLRRTQEGAEWAHQNLSISITLQLVWHEWIVRCEMKMLWSATRDHINCVPSLCVLGPFMCKQAENKKPLLSQLPSTQQIKWAVDQINFVLFYAPKHFLLPTWMSHNKSAFKKQKRNRLSSFYWSTKMFSFDCLGFAYRQPQTAGEVLNCDLTDKVIFQQ